ncbi:MAG TPA: ABC transporter permease [Pyrinomonadaceae bacterium]|jgi:putative ABC transport system permease protein|nr:ABC transporter permease [Pyrinomonadaceae bacterium]
MNTLLQDIRFGLRMLLKSPSISIVATIALALGIGANTAIFSVVNAVLLRPLPFPDPDSLVALFETDTQRGQQRGSHSYPNFMDVRAQNTVFEHVSTYHGSDYIMTGRGEPARLQGAVVTTDLFPLLGVQPMLGRTFLPDEDKPTETGRVVILSHALFQQRFGGDPSILNQSITLEGISFTVVGVMPPSFEFPIQNDPVELWTTIAGDASGDEPITVQRGAHFLNVIGRLKPGVTQEQAQAELTAIAARLEQQYPDTNTHKSLRIESALTALVGDIRPALLILLGAVACVLLIACANVANLLLARATSRHKEMAIRVALGASRTRVVRQLLTESVLLSLVGGGVGMLLAVWWSDLMVALGKEDIPRAIHVGMDWRVLGFTLGVSLLTGLIFGLAPAFHSSKTELVESLKEGARGTSAGSFANVIRKALVVIELGFAVLLLTGAALLIQSLWRLQTVNSGLRPENILTFNVTLPDVKYKSERQSQFFIDLKKRLEATPGVQSASSILPLPLSGDRFGISFEIEGRPVAPKDQPSADFFTTGVGYFKTMGIPLIKGRDFDDRDRHGSTPVIIVTETFARQHFPNEDPIGKRIKPGISTFEDEKSTMREIVGVVGDIRNRSLSTESKPAYYVPQTQVPFTQMVTVVKTVGEPRSLISAATKEVAAMDQDVPLFSVKSMEEYLSASVAAPRFSTTLLSIFAGVALVLTIVGLYGVMSYSVAQRTNEIGIRMALGAQSHDVLLMIVRQGSILILIGLAIGLTGAFALTRLISSLLFGVTAKDPFTFVVVSVLLAFVALLACYVPALRATKVDPMDALRCE